MIQKPLDALNLMKGANVAVELKSGQSFEGKLTAFDLNTNITLEIEGKQHSIQGKNIVTIGKI